jgi:hypothetical protein
VTRRRRAMELGLSTAVARRAPERELAVVARAQHARAAVATVGMMNAYYVRARLADEVARIPARVTLKK